ncbi:molybdenum ABC transporter ATP-binding protein [Paraglaciecola aquimarina]|uniref:Molybdenum ABC transporter ATP-binding protein n=1 Tax=Paraglaciecola aquimarina TaxID=1235557 RepID=A0ABU3SXN9_9ALTE|nr:molybdenum ABC transporter ATP-binding protein [Paraglaciecola aquimarina]MDU0354737.1 molybdenum ABC transporter ATP-binding protein [Paraglaciecola aquimarina]
MEKTNISISFTLGGKQPYLDVHTDMPSKGVTAILGESGSGKTSLLRCIAGLEKAPHGRCWVNGRIWQDKQYFVKTHKRKLGYVFQEASLFAHLTAKNNLLYAIKRSTNKCDQGQLNKVIDVLGLQLVLGKYPAQLSGGERQRVAIARAILAQPNILLMDEPLASLDSARKQEVLPYLERLAGMFELPILYVTHAMDEVMRLADYGLVMKEGRIIAQGKVPELFNDCHLQVVPETELGAVLECQVVAIDNAWSLMKVNFVGGQLWIPAHENSQGAKCRVRILASDISICLQPPVDNSILNQLEVEIKQIDLDEHPAMALLTLTCGGSQLLARLTQKSVADLGLVVGINVWAMIKSVAIVR